MANILRAWCTKVPHAKICCKKESICWNHPGQPVTLNSEVGGTRRLTKEITLDKGQYKSRFIFHQTNICVLKNCIYQIYMTKKACMAEIKVSMPMIRSKNKFKQQIFIIFKVILSENHLFISKGIFSRKTTAGF